MPADWKNPPEGTMNVFLEEMEALLSKYYRTDWYYKFDGEDTWIDLQLQIPSDTNEEGEGN